MNVKRMIAIFSVLALCFAVPGLFAEDVAADAGADLPPAAPSEEIPGAGVDDGADGEADTGTETPVVPELGPTDYYVTYKVDDTVIFIDTTATKDNVYTLKGADTVTADLVPEGKTFAGWLKTAPESTEDVLAAGAPVVNTGNLVFTAQFTPIQCVVTFVNGETTVTTATVDHGTTLQAVLDELGDTVALDDTESAYFTSWGIEAPEEKEITADLTLTAVFTPIYKVTWMLDEVVIKIDQTTREGNLPACPIADEDVAKPNHDFNGWAIAGDKVNLEEFIPSADVIISAIFTPAKLVVTFVDGETVVDKIVALYGKIIDPADVPAGYDWDFDFTVAVTEDTTIKTKVVAPAPEVPEEPVEDSNTDTTVLMALFGILIVGGLILGIRQLKKN